MPRKMGETDLQDAFDSATRLFRRDSISEHEFTQKILLEAVFHSDDLPEVIPNFSCDELRVITSVFSARTKEESLRMCSQAFVVDFNEEGIVDHTMERIRSKFDCAARFFDSLSS